MTLGSRMKFVRKSNKMSQIAFAKTLGISQTHVSKIEKDIERPSETLLRFTSYMFAVNIEWLKTGEGEPHEYNGELTKEFDAMRQKLEVMMKYMNEHQSLDFFDAFKYFNSIYTLNFDEKKGFEDNQLIAFKDVLKSLFILIWHFKITGDMESEKQVILLKDSVDKYIEAVLKK